MKDEQLKNILQSPYDRENWKVCLKNIFFKKDLVIYIEPKSIEIDTQEAHNLIKSFYQIGLLRLPMGAELPLYEVILNDNIRIEYNKVGVNNFIKKYIVKDAIKGALVTFAHSEKEKSEWRFSFISKNSASDFFAEAESRETNPKKYTYIFGTAEQHTTAIARLNFLKESNSEIDDFFEAFSVEKLSDTFFNEYKTHYDDFVEFITGKRFVKEKGKWVEKETYQPNEQYKTIFNGEDKSVRDYVKKLLGRLVFLHFLQKKNWLCNDVNYLKNLFENSQKENFLENVLKPLFFGVLNTKKEERKALFIKENWDNNLLKSWEEIPYLNGGLFEKDELDSQKVIFPKHLFAKLFDFFSQYNFTIDENDPEDAQVGIDPEMLGKIFENLLEDNKDKGAFYTPKEIVQYMCRESIIAYLVEKQPTEEKNIRLLVEKHTSNFSEETKGEILKHLHEVKICDPAIGSGAFPMGILNELYKCRLALGEDKSINIKKEIIQSNIYGVDIEKGAVDIARLRFWLALVVEEEEPEPLPNLDYKIMQGNSLLESYQGVDLSDLTKKKMVKAESYMLSIFDDEVDVIRKELIDLMSSYYSENEYNKKMSIRGKIQENIRKQIEAKQYKVDLNNIDLSANTHFFLWHTYFADVFNRANSLDNGFDIVIGNPPYFVYQATSKDEIQNLRKQKELSIAFDGKLNAYKLFLAKALKSITRENGIVSFIFQNSFLGDKQAKSLREYVLENTQLLIIDSFPERDSKRKRVFESVKMSVCIVLIKNSKENKPFVVNTWEDKDKNKGISTLFDINDIKAIDKELFSIPRLKQENLPIIVKMKSNTIKADIYCYEGELNMTFHKKYFSKNINDAQILKGASIQRYFWTTKTSQGEIEFLNTENYLQDYSKSEKSKHYQFNRIALQGMTGANDKIRIIATIVPKNIFLANSCNYILPTENIDIYYLLGVLNSKPINWYFRCFSTNSNVNGYEVNNLPIPNILPEEQKTIISLVEKILSTKKESPNADTSALEKEIDRLVYQLYGLTEEEINIVENQ